MNEVVAVTFFDITLVLSILGLVLLAILMLNFYIKKLNTRFNTVVKNVKFLNKQRMQSELDVHKFSTITAVNESKIKQVKLQSDKEIFIKHASSCAGTLDILFISFLEKASLKEIEKLAEQYDDGRHSVLMAILETFRGKKAYLASITPMKSAKKDVSPKTKTKTTKKKVVKKTKKKTVSKTKS